ncbi:MAG: hypothetical protein Pars2KO_07710 [Parasphingorhabdus sp.]
MSEIIKAGTKLSSAVCQTQIMALRVPAEELEITCGGAAMSSDDGDTGEIDPNLAGGTLVGKRYVDEGETMEFLCTRGGDGTVQVNGVSLDVKQAKQLPSSD